MLFCNQLLMQLNITTMLSSNSVHQS